jgi:competence ComEA-like helix-hairpin-helix protein
MKQSLLEQTTLRNSTSAEVRLSQPLGYRFSGDTVHLKARFTVVDPAAHQRSWALQLWACPTAPTSASDLAGTMVAEVSLPPMREVADEIEHLEMSALATPPAGGAEHLMALVLAAGGPGDYSQIHDIAAFPRSERFVQPQMRGAVAYRIEGGRVHLSAEHIENPRDPANCSGTLVLELWALAAPYKGGNFRGVPLAGIVIGTLAGQTESATTSFELPFSSPPTGQWYFVMMLRESTAAGYVTRDFTNFSRPVVYGPSGSATTQTSDEVPASSLAKTNLTQTAPSNAATAVAVTGSCPDTAPAPPTSAGKRRNTAEAPITPVVTGADQILSINTAAAEELAALDGISPKLAQAIIRKRPFSSLDELRRIRGITVKLLTRIRARLRL